MWSRPSALLRIALCSSWWVVARGASITPVIQPVCGPVSWPTPNSNGQPPERSAQMRRLASALPSRPHKRKHQRVWVK